jgi:hypothetical protein
MRKRQISATPLSVPSSGQTWLDVERTALVEVTSEENGFPINDGLLTVEILFKKSCANNGISAHRSQCGR